MKTQAGRQGSHAFLLSIMMLLQYAVWGLWVPYLANYLGAPMEKGGLGFTQYEIGGIMGFAAAVGALAAPFVAGQIADRFFDAEKALAGLLFLGGAVNMVLSTVTEFTPFLVLSVLYSVFYMPTVGLTNSVAFANLRHRERHWPVVRSLGTIGWILASVLFSWLWLSTNDDVVNTRRIADALLASGALSILYALYAFFILPRTPPEKSSESPLAFTKAFRMLKHPGFALVMAAALPISIIHAAFWFRYAPYLKDVVLDGLPLQDRQAWIGPISAIGQASEILVLILLGFFVRNLGYRRVLLMGCAAYVLRAGIFAIGDPVALVIAAQALHGFCFGCFIAAAFMYVERVSPVDIRHSAQAVLGIVILGIGPVLAGPFSGFFDRFKQPGGIDDYIAFWWAVAGFALLAALLLMLFFRREHEPVPETVLVRDGGPS